MAVGASRVADLNSLFNNIYEDAYFALREQNLMTRLVQTFTDGRGDQTRQNSDYPTVTPVSVAETEDFAAPTRFDKTAGQTLTPGEVMSQVILTDRRIETDPQNARNDASLEMGAGMAEKVDTDLMGNFNSMTGGTVGASGSTMTWGYFYAAISVMRGAKIPRPWYCVLHPYAWHYMAETAAVASTVTNAPDFQDAVMRQWYVGSASGVDIFISANCELSGTDYYSGMFNPQAIAFDLRRDLRLEPERDASKRAWELNMTMLYAHGVWRPTWGVQILHDGTTPS
jgi:hypothetical protein